MSKNHYFGCKSGRKIRSTLLKAIFFSLYLYLQNKPMPVEKLVSPCARELSQHDHLYAHFHIYQFKNFLNHPNKRQIVWKLIDMGKNTWKIVSHSYFSIFQFSWPPTDRISSKWLFFGFWSISASRKFFFLFLSLKFVFFSRNYP